MKIMLVNAPSRRFSIVPPLGLLQVGAILEEHGHLPLLYDPMLIDPGMTGIGYDKILDIIEDFKPDIVGYGGIATSYGSVKKFSLRVKSKHPRIKQIAGGPLSSVYDLLLTRSGIDLVVHGEAEVSLPLLLERLENESAIEDIPGISYVSRNGAVKRNNPARQVEDLDSLPLPAYHLIDVPVYFRHIKNSFASFPRHREIMEKIGNDDRWIEIVTGRGCTHKCLFCYRHMKGIRYHSPSYVVGHIKFLMDNYGIRGFQFADELFNATKDRIRDMCRAIRDAKLDIFFTIGGARVDHIDEDLLRELKEVGCIEISYGQESGSDKILKEYKKGVTVEQNRKITNLTKSIGINCPVQIVIGSPGETSETIQETITFLKDVNAHQYSLNYLIPLPETPIWTYVEEKKLIEDVEHYLNQVALYGGQPIVNLTRAKDKEWKSWRTKIGKEMRLDYSKKQRKPFKYVWEYLIYSVALFFIPYLPLDFSARLKGVFRLFLPHHGS